jgi:dTMP kinase
VGEPRGRFIVLEGLDGAGTTTQAKMLHDALRDKGIVGHLTREPTDEAVGKLIRDALLGKLVSDDASKPLILPESVLCLLFAADRIHHSELIESLRDAGTHVICDRYVHSSIAYQSLDADISHQRVIDVNDGISVPDVTIFIRVPVAQCLERLGQRGDTLTVYEKEDLLVAIERNYDASLPLYQKTYGDVIEINGTQTPDAVHAAIRQNLTGLLSF